MNTRIILQKNGKTIFSLKCKLPKKSAYGELDIMMDAGKNLYFDQVVAGNFFRHYQFPKEKINSVSWHGYYEKINERFLNTPIIHFKNGHTKIAREWHLGSINHEEPFAFPICSLYLPQQIDLSNTYPSEYEEHKKIKYYIKAIVEGEKRIDIFVTPKGLSAKRVLKSSLGFVYRLIDVDMFNDGLGILTFLNEEDKNNNFEIVEDNSGHDMIIRTVNNLSSTSKFSCLNGTFSLLVHDPNDAYNRFANRFIIELDEEANVLSEKELFSKTEVLKEKYEKEIKC